MRRVLLIFWLVSLSACVDRAQIIVAPDAVGDLPTTPVFIATTRAPDSGVFGPGRAQAPSYLRYEISVPPDRARGEITFGADRLDPETQFLAKSQVAFPDAAAFRVALRDALAETPGREAIIYVHGFNNTFDEGVLRIAQLAQDFQVDGVALHYAWPSAGSAFGYAYDRDSVLFARDGLDALISETLAAGARSVAVISHSVGSQLTMEVLRQRAIAAPGSVARDIDGVVLISPDIDIDLFRLQAERIGTLPDAFGIFVSQRDRALALSARLTGQDDRLGNASAEDVADLDVTLVDVSEFSEGLGHFTAADSPALIALFSNAETLAAAFRGDSAGRPGLLPGTVLTVQNATQIILSPVGTLAQ